LRDLLASAVNMLPGQGDMMQSVSARRCCEVYQAADENGKLLFLQLLGREFGTQQREAVAAAEQYANGTNPDVNSKPLLRLEQVLRHTMQPASYRFFDRVNRLPGGMRFLVELRTDLLSFMSQRRDDADLAAVNYALRDKLQGWLIGFLELGRITWASPASLLEKVTEYEAVHEFDGWKDLKQQRSPSVDTLRRLGPGRRCFGFFHQSLPLEPLVSVQVALVREISDNVQAILQDPSPGHASHDTVKCAIFYSISTQKGLSGVELGSFLIKRVVGELKVEFPGLHTFCTLSPITRFRHWLQQRAEQSDLLLSTEAEAIQRAASKRAAMQLTSTAHTAWQDLTENVNWMQDDTLSEQLRAPLLRLCARYLVLEKRGVFPFDPVANFHLRNGACIHRINWLANTTGKGNEESFGMMVNYNYLQSHVEDNNQAYLLNGRIAVN
ncbi:malonyl-CoA decarboxylase-domain-containing protein, partial [Thamnocephalis sphaerospora]